MSAPHIPAFPITAGNQVYAKGMSLRDWLAGQAQIGPDEIGVNLAEALMGEKVINYTSDPVAAVKWWAQAEAKLRFIKADAMLAERVTA